MNKFINKSVYIMPFTTKSILLFHILRNNNIDVLGFCDNNHKLYSEKYLEKPICSPHDAYQNNSDVAILLSEVKFLYELEYQLHNVGFDNIIRINELFFDEDLLPYIPLMNCESNKDIIKNIKPFIESTVKLIKYGNNTNYILGVQSYDTYKFNDYTLSADRNIMTSFVVCVNATQSNIKYIDECLTSIYNQSYANYRVVIVTISQNVDYINQVIAKNKYNKIDLCLSQRYINNLELFSDVKKKYNSLNRYDYFVTVGANDELVKGALDAFVINIHEYNNYTIFTANEDRLYYGEYIAPFYKCEYQKEYPYNTVELLRNILCVRINGNYSVYDVTANEIYVINEMLYHYRICQGTSKNPKIKPIAFYLPQFHTIPENDKWWGEGFTEWKNVKRAYPMFNGHYQPHIPREFGYYNLIEEKDIQKKQIDLAKKFGIHGFCYYYYWFNGKRLLEKPLDNVINNPDLDMPFCICWANENWTRRWDGLENEVLIEQNHNLESDINFICDIIPILKDPRYIRIGEAPLLLIYRFDKITNLKQTVDKWREIAKENGIYDLHISIVNTTNCSDLVFESLGVDSETEFPPHQIKLPRINYKIDNLNNDFTGAIFDYNEYVNSCIKRKHRKRLCFRGIMNGFDNTARRLNSATIYHGSTPQNYKKLLVSLVDYTSRYPENERFIFINAWNEWAEGNHLEPDVKFGDTYLRATNEAININC